ncbi:MAG: hypothetical protein R3C45_05630 [Phycisphaerales bacterium]
MPAPGTRYRKHSPRQQGSVYVLVLGASLIVAAVGVSSLVAARVQYRFSARTAESIKARELARTAIDRALWEVQNNALLWRTNFATNVYTNVSLAGGTFTIGAIDPVDNNLLNNTTDPVQLLGIGIYGESKFILSVTLNGDGSLKPGTWKRVVY